MKKLVLLTLLTWSCIPVLFAQSLEYRTHWQQGYRTFGLNVGNAFITGDVNPCTFDGLGAGFTLGKNIYHRPGAVFNFDARLRGLYAQAFGSDWRSSTGFKNNYALNGGRSGGLNFVSGTYATPYIFHNYRHRQLEGGGELLLGFNRLRENTGIVFNLYGGIGLNGHIVQYDHRQLSSLPYDYAAIDAGMGRAAIEEELRQLRDGAYDTWAEGFDNGHGRVGLMPYGGLELGYQLGRYFWAGLGYKLTYSNSDYLDGQRWNNDNRLTNDKDWHHYTNLILQWHINPSTRRLRPDVEIRVPQSGSATVQFSRYIVRASTRNVRTPGEVQVLHNGTPVYFEFNQGAVNVPLNLLPGQNEVVIHVSNTYGEDTDRAMLVYDYIPTGPVIPGGPTNPNTPPQTGNPPRINITNPSNNVTVTRPQTPINATISHVTNQDQVRLYVNEIEIRNFSLKNDRLSAQVNLVNGRNVIRVTAVNNFGQDQQEIAVIYDSGNHNGNRPPTVLITQPMTNDAIANSANYVVEAQITNVSDRNSVTFVFNGNNVTNFSYDGNNGLFSCPVKLEPGTNTVYIRATNAFGSDTDESQVRLLEGGGPNKPTDPLVEIIQPANNSTTTQSTTLLTAKTARVVGKSNITVTVNGVNVPDFTFDKVKEVVTANINLQPGNNVIRVTATQGGKTAEASTNITFNKLPTPPVVTINRPGNNTTVTKAEADLQATVLHVSNTNAVTVTHNGRVLNNVTLTNGALNAPLTLLEGNNNITVRATNADGSDEQTVRVTYNRTKTPPVVNITRPTRGATTNKAEAELSAAVTNITNKSDISVKLNGRDIPFTFVQGSGTVTAPLTLVEGQNTVLVRATNVDGSDEASVGISYNKPKNPPVVSISRPTRGATTIRPDSDLAATVTNITNKSDITVKLNGRDVPFTFIQGTGTVTASLTLTEGNNTITVKATNADGTDEKTASITYNKLSTGDPRPPVDAAQKPTVKIVNPKKSGIVVNKPQRRIQAITTGIKDKREINITVNGAMQKNYQFDAATGVIVFTSALNNGANTIEITVTNAAGTATASTTLTYSVASPALPTVVIETLSVPVNNPFDPNPNSVSNLVAKTENVTAKEQISLKINGATITNFIFDSSSGTVTHNFNLVKGSNTVTITVTTPQGTDTDSQTVQF